MRRVFYCLQFGAPAAKYKPIKRAQALPLPAPLPTYCPPCNRGLWAILSARGPYRPPCAQAYARAHAPARARVHAPARMTRPLPFCFNSCRQTLPFFAGKRINFCRQTLWFFISPKPFLVADFPPPCAADRIYRSRTVQARRTRAFLCQSRGT